MKNGSVFSIHSTEDCVDRGMTVANLTVANLAVLFYREGLTTLVVDSGLAAPGIERYFESKYQSQLAELDRRLGLRDVIEHYTTSVASQANSGFGQQPFPSVEKTLIPLDCRDDCQLLLLHWASRGADDSGQTEPARPFDWTTFRDKYDGHAFLRDLCRRLRRIADIVLIESPTSGDNLAWAAAGQEADAVLILCQSNSRSIDDAARLARQLADARSRDSRVEDSLEFLVIPTQADSSKGEADDTWLTHMSEAFSDIPLITGSVEHNLRELLLPHVPLSAADSGLIVDNSNLGEPARRLVGAYSRIRDWMLSPARTIAGFDDVTVDSFPPREAPNVAEEAPPQGLETVDIGQSSELTQAAPVKTLPESNKIGRYRIERLVEDSGFEKAYLAHDDELGRSVAIRVSNRKQPVAAKDVDAYLERARLAAKLEHPRIVPIYDVGRTDEGLCYLVSKWIESRDLEQVAHECRGAFDHCARIVAAIADALHYAHDHDVIHHNIHPSNILFDDDGNPYLTGFGLGRYGQDHRGDSTPFESVRYISPEQALGEQNVDGRSDIYSLGVVLYEMLLGQSPYHGREVSAVLRQIRNGKVRAPREIDATVPDPLEQICLRALALRVTDRYPTAGALADDLNMFLGDGSSSRDALLGEGPTSEHEHWGASDADDHEIVFPAEASGLTAPEVDSQPRTSPKGLVAFDDHDWEMFPWLLPGPRDHDEVPRSIQFWKRRIEEKSPDLAFRVGLLYGPTGCGKTSFLRAGLLPRLNDSVTVISIDAGSPGVEEQLKKKLIETFSVQSESSLPEVLSASLTSGGLSPGHKVLIVIDQFEQWLRSSDARQDTELIEALGQCDGPHLQCLLSVRSDFLTGIQRFMRELDVPIQEGANSASVDLFDSMHARNVLLEFGRALGRLPTNGQEESPRLEPFLTEVIAELEANERIVPTHLSMFAEVFRSRTWDMATLRQMGGATGAVVRFLDETFQGDKARLELRGLVDAARAVLNCLLPEPGVDVRQQRQSHDELLRASQLEHDPGQFDVLLRALDRDLRLITPTDAPGQSETTASQNGDSNRHVRCYQLAHACIVPWLRRWLTSTQLKSAHGRARQVLDARTDLWLARSEDRHLPSLWEHIRIRLLVSRKTWNKAHQRLMRRALAYHAVRVATGALLVLLATVLVNWFGRG